MKKLKLLSAVLAAGMVLTATATGCKSKTTEKPIDLSGAVEREDYTSVYDKIGNKVTIDMVTEDENGFAYATVDGIKYTLGMDFLSMAMVYNTQVPAGSTKYTTSEDVYNEWWKLYIQRWNYLMPEVPLYSNDYYDLYSARFENFETTPYWGVADAVVATTVKSGASSIILGSNTDLSGAFRNASWGKSSPGSSDLDIQNLTTGYSTINTDKTGSYKWNMSALAEVPTQTFNADGTMTYTIKIKEGNVFSDGTTPITAKNYLVSLLCNSSPVGVEADGTGSAGQTMVGFSAFKAYDGTNDGQSITDKDGKATGVTASKWFDGVKLIDDYTFSVTYTSKYAGYYYSIIYAGFSPDVETVYLGSGAIVVDPDTKKVGLDAEFYRKSGDKYANSSVIEANIANNSVTAFPYSGPYYVESYNDSAKTATLKKNSYFNGGDAANGGDPRGTASIETISYIKITDETQFDMFKRGEVDVLAGITGADSTKNAIQLTKDSPNLYKETHYARAGYGKLGFRCDYGPTSMVEVRQAITYSINRDDFAKTFTGGYGKVVHGPYYEGFSAFVAHKDDINLNSYNYSVDSAIEVLEDAGWIYDKNGNEYKSGIRYKKLTGYEKSVDNLKFKTVNGRYKTVKVGDDYYMPLAINWYGTIPNPVTDQLKTDWLNGSALNSIGMYVQYISTDFNGGVYGEFYRVEGYGYNGTPKLNAINFASGFTSAAYDYAFNWTIDPDMYDDMSTAYLMDEADFWADYQTKE